MRVYQGVLDDDSTYKLDCTCENRGTETFAIMRNADVIIYTARIILYIYVVCSTSDITFQCKVALHL